MKRLTHENWRGLSPAECCRMSSACTDLILEGPGSCANCPLPRLYAKLAAYEDTGLRPEQIDPRFVRPLKAKVRRVKK